MGPRLDGLRALVTGGTRGIGRATTFALAEGGAEIVVCYGHDEPAAEDLAREAKERDLRVTLVRADVTDSSALATLADECRRVLGGLDIVVNNAGVDAMALFADLPDDEWARILEINLTSIFRVTRAVLPLLARGSSVVNVGAAVAMRGMPGRTHYSAAKAGVLGLTRSLAKELGPRGVRVNAVQPGVIETEPDAGLPKPIRDRVAGMTALGRLGAPTEAAAAIVFLAGELSRYVTGIALTVDGGI